MSVYILDLDGTLTAYPGYSEFAIHQMARTTKWSIEYLLDNSDLYDKEELRLIALFLEKISKNNTLMILTNNVTKVVDAFMGYLINKFKVTIKWTNAFLFFHEKKTFLERYSFDKYGALKFLTKHFKDSKLVYFDDDAAYYNQLKDEERSNVEFHMIYDSKNYIGKALHDKPFILDCSDDVLISYLAEYNNLENPKSPINTPAESNQSNSPDLKLVANKLRLI